MKDKLSTRYIGNVESWSDFWRQVVGCGKFYNFFGQEDGQNLIVEINKILANISLNQDFYKSKIKAYPFEVPNSFKDLWLSGTIDIFEIIFSYFEGYNNEFQPKKGVYYFKLFLNPEYVEQFKNLLKKKKNIFPNSRLQYSMLEEMVNRQNSCETGFYEKNFYKYPHDEAINPITLNSRSMYEMYILLDGWIEVDGGALFMIADESFLNNEFEVGVLSYSEASWQRYQTIPEPFLYTLAYILFGVEVYSIDELLRYPIFQLLYE